jgi:hypothetical protein
VLALAAACARLLHLSTLQIDIERSFATSLRCLPLYNSFMTAAQSTSLPANVGLAIAATTIIAANIADAAKLALFLITIFPLQSVAFRVVDTFRAGCSFA